MLCLSLIFASCSKYDDNDNKTTSKSEVNDNIETDEGETILAENLIPPDIEAVDYENRAFAILNREPDGSYVFPYDEVLSEEQNGETLNDAVYKRNLFIEEKYNVKIVSIGETSTNIKSLTTKSVQSGDAAYDIILPMTSGAFSLATTGILYELSDIPYINSSKEWWMESILADTSIGFKNYFIAGDINLSVMDAVGITYFNKGLAEKHNIINLYDIVLDNQWTLDTFTALSRNITQDLNGDGVFDGDDMFGFTCNGFVWQPFFYGTNSMMVKKDSNDIPYLDYESERIVTVIQTLVNFLNDKTSTILVNQYPELQTATGWGQASIDMFTQDRSLFWVEIIYGVPQLRDMNTDFGILPMPKYDENQEEYTSYIHAAHSSVVAIPITNTELEMTGMILEDMAYQSYLTVRPAFYDTMLKTKYTRDEQSVEMLDIIYSNIIVDLTMAMQESGLTIDTTMRNAVINNNTNIVSQFEKDAQLNAAAIENITNAILNIE